MFDKEQPRTNPVGITRDMIDEAWVMEWVRQTMERKDERDCKGRRKYWVKLQHGKSLHYALRWKERSWEEIALPATLDATAPNLHSARNLVLDPPAFRSHPLNSAKITKPTDPRFALRTGGAPTPFYPTPLSMPAIASSFTPAVDEQPGTAPSLSQRPQDPRIRPPVRVGEL
ncbi:hypothetical protein IAR50_006773 [Cryptococcus sp. DSM 104548]